LNLEFGVGRDEDCEAFVFGGVEQVAVR
jgi:hypothetical protein